MESFDLARRSFKYPSLDETSGLNRRSSGRPRNALVPRGRKYSDWEVGESSKTDQIPLSVRLQIGTMRGLHSGLSEVFRRLGYADVLDNQHKAESITVIRLHA